MRNLIICFLGVFSCTLFSCASDHSTKQETIFVNYYIRYLEPENQFKAEATFLSGDSIQTALPKEIADGVYFQKDPMILQDLKTRGIRYQLQKKRPYATEYSFKFKDDKGKEQLYQTSMTPITRFSIKDKISKTTDLTLNWEGEALKENESLVFLFDTPDKKALMTNIDGPTKTNEAVIPASKFSNVTTGKGKIYLVKKQVQKQILEHLSTTSTLEYYTSTIDVEVVE